MTIYGESGTRFRPRPSKVAVAAVCSSLFLIFLLLSTYGAAAGDLILASRHGMESVALDPALFSAPRLQTTTAAGEIERAAVPAALVGIGAIVLFLFPTAQKLESRLAVQLFALASATTALRIAAAERESVIMLAAGALSILLAYASEKSAITILAQLYDLQHPLRRVTLLITRLSIAFALLIALSLLSESFEALLSLAVIGVVMLLAALATKPAERWEELRDPHMRESAAVLPLIAIAALLAHFWFFGLASVREQRFVYSSGDTIRFAPRSSIESFVRSRKKAPEPPATDTQGDPSIRIEWAR